MVFGKFEGLSAFGVKALFDHSVGAFAEKDNFSIDATNNRHTFANIVKVKDVKNVEGSLFSADDRSDCFRSATLSIIINIK